MSFDIQNWYDNINEGDVLIAYKGDVTTELISNVLEVVEAKLDDNNESSKLRRKVYNVLVECLQNLYHHIDSAPVNGDDVSGKYAIFVISKIEEYYRISTGNFLNIDRVQMMQDRINQINSLDRNELKALYKMILNNQEYSEKGGGGLGMIDIARRTGNKLEYNFNSIDDKKIFFCLSINIE